VFFGYFSEKRSKTQNGSGQVTLQTRANNGLTPAVADGHGWRLTVSGCFEAIVESH